MPLRSTCFGLVCTLLAAANVASAKQRATVELVPGVATAARGETFDVALKFKIDPEWHLYWLNPGDTGRAPQVSWTAPPGVTVGEPRFPVPEKISSFGAMPMTAFGYERELVLLVPVTVGPDVQGPIELKAEADWIVCKRECVAEDQTLSLTIPVGEKATPANETNFARWRSLQPQREGTPKTEVVIDADGKRGEVRIELPEGVVPTAFFPPATPFAQFEKQEPKAVQGADGKSRWVAGFRVLPGKHTSRSDPAIVVTKDLDGKSVAFEVVCNFAIDLK